ncbi:ankyrin repeat domain-containing protein 50-like [Physella acuta]|uniref:ankyrin repeat domain-containing protein 50-like n=1 Tax=Physella acuta TaxID=109671 RepID=UPI0027DB4122|nr:ankyrin repeat domain-containing protein 50-like [Physella acuta]
MASCLGYDKIVEVLLKNRANIKLQNSDGCTALFIAIEQGHVGTTHLLIERGASVFHLTANNDTTLMTACRAGKLDIVTLLLDKNFNVNLRNKQEMTALLVAAYGGHTDVMETLLKHGANPNYSTSFFVSASRIAIGKGDTKMLKVLIDGGLNMNAVDSFGCNILHSCILQFLHETTYFELGFLLFSEEKEYDEIKKLFDKLLNLPNAKSNLKSSEYTSKVYTLVSTIAIKLKKLTKKYHNDTKVNIIERWINKSDNMYFLNFKEEARKVPKKDPSLVQFLIINNANVNLMDKSGLTPLMMTCMINDSAVAKVLLNNNADPNQVTHTGYTPLVLASLFGNTETIHLLISYGAEVNFIHKKMHGTALFAAAFSGETDAVNVLIGYGACVNLSSTNRQTPLIVASSKGHLDIVNILLQNNANINAQDKEGASSLIKACEAGHRTMVEKLLESGANVNICKTGNESALITATRCGDAGIVKALLDHGADIHCVTDNGENSLLIALQRGDVDSSSLLIERGAKIDTVLLHAMFCYLQYASQELTVLENTHTKLDVEPFRLQTSGFTTLLAAVMLRIPDCHEILSKNKTDSDQSSFKSIECDGNVLSIHDADCIYDVITSSDVETFLKVFEFLNKIMNVATGINKDDVKVKLILTFSEMTKSLLDPTPPSEGTVILLIFKVI